MKLQTLRRGTAAAAVLALSVTLGACGSENDDAGSDAGSDTESSAPTETETSPMEEETSMPAEGDAAVFGPACDQLPQGSEAGSLESMVTDPVATAASTNPLLTTLVTAVSAVEGLPGTLDTAPALTVFAPANDAFAALGDKAVNDLVAGAKKDGLKSDLATVLSHHVLGENLDPMAVVGDQKTLIGDSLTVAGDPEAGMTVSDGKVEAKVLCGGIPTANATVYVIDSVLTNAKPTG